MAHHWVDERGLLTNVYFSLSSKTNPRGVENTELVTTFSKPILYARGQYEAALVNLRFSPAKQVPKVIEIEHDEPHVGPLFPNKSAPTVTKYTPIKEDQQLLKFMANITRKMMENGYRIIYKITSNRGEPLRVHVVIQHDTSHPGMFLRFDPDLADLLGFKRTDFYPGVSLPEDIIYDKAFQAVPVGKTYDIQYVTPTYLGNILQVGVRRELTYPTYKVKEREFPEFLTWLSASSLREAGLRITFRLDAKNVCTMELHSFLDDDGDTISLPAQLAKAFSFDSNTFKPGVHVATRPVDDKVYNNIGLLEDLWFIKREIVPMQVYMNEPENLELDSVISSINEAMKTIHYFEPVIFKYYKGKLGFQIESDDVTVILPDAVNSYFGFPAQQMFRSGVQEAVKKSLIPEEDQKPDGYWPPPDVKPTEVLITSSLCANQYYENEPLPLLRQLDIPIPSLNTQHKINCDPLIYVPMEGNEFSVVRLKLYDEYMRPLALQPDSTTSAQLHIRLRV